MHFTFIIGMFASFRLRKRPHNQIDKSGKEKSRKEVWKINYRFLQIHNSIVEREF